MRNYSGQSNRGFREPNNYRPCPPRFPTPHYDPWNQPTHPQDWRNNDWEQNFGPRSYGPDGCGPGRSWGHHQPNFEYRGGPGPWPNFEYQRGQGPPPPLQGELRPWRGCRRPPEHFVPRRVQGHGGRSEPHTRPFRPRLDSSAKSYHQKTFEATGSKDFRNFEEPFQMISFRDEKQIDFKGEGTAETPVEFDHAKPPPLDHLGPVLPPSHLPPPPILSEDSSSEKHQNIETKEEVENCGDTAHSSIEEKEVCDLVQDGSLNDKTNPIKEETLSKIKLIRATEDNVTNSTSNKTESSIISKDDSKQKCDDKNDIVNGNILNLNESVNDKCNEMNNEEFLLNNQCPEVNEDNDDLVQHQPTAKTDQTDPTLDSTKNQQIKDAFLKKIEEIPEVEPIFNLNLGAKQASDKAMNTHNDMLKECDQRKEWSEIKEEESPETKESPTKDQSLDSNAKEKRKDLQSSAESVLEELKRRVKDFKKKERKVKDMLANIANKPSDIDRNRRLKEEADIQLIENETYKNVILNCMSENLPDFCLVVEVKPGFNIESVEIADIFGIYGTIKDFLLFINLIRIEFFETSLQNRPVDDQDSYCVVKSTLPVKQVDIEKQDNAGEERVASTSDQCAVNDPDYPTADQSAGCQGRRSVLPGRVEPVIRHESESLSRRADNTMYYQRWPDTGRGDRTPCKHGADQFSSSLRIYHNQYEVDYKLDPSPEKHVERSLISRNDCQANGNGKYKLRFKNGVPQFKSEKEIRSCFGVFGSVNLIHLEDDETIGSSNPVEDDSCVYVEYNTIDALVAAINSVEFPCKVTKECQRKAGFLRNFSRNQYYYKPVNRCLNTVQTQPPELQTRLLLISNSCAKDEGRVVRWVEDVPDRPRQPSVSSPRLGGQPPVKSPRLGGQPLVKSPHLSRQSPVDSRSEFRVSGEKRPRDRDVRRRRRDSQDIIINNSDVCTRASANTNREEKKEIKERSKEKSNRKRTSRDTEGIRKKRKVDEALEEGELSEISSEEGELRQKTSPGGVSSRVGASSPPGGVRSRIGASSPPGGVSSRVGASSPQGGVNSRVGASSPQGVVSSQVGASSPLGGVSSRVGAPSPPGGVSTQVGASSPAWTTTLRDHNQRQRYADSSRKTSEDRSQRRRKSASPTDHQTKPSAKKQLDPQIQLKQKMFQLAGGYAQSLGGSRAKLNPIQTEDDDDDIQVLSCHVVPQINDEAYENPAIETEDVEDNDAEDEDDDIIVLEDSTKVVDGSISRAASSPEYVIAEHDDGESDETQEDEAEAGMIETANINVDEITVEEDSRSTAQGDTERLVIDEREDDEGQDVIETIVGSSEEEDNQPRRKANRVEVVDLVDSDDELGKFSPIQVDDD